MHVVCDITRAEAILKEVDDLRAKGWNGKLAWEPLIRVGCYGVTEAHYSRPRAPRQQPTLRWRADSTSSGRVPHAYRAALTPSPNHLELQAILNSTDDVETNARTFAALCPTPIAVRAGENGAYVLSKEWSGWVPAYWRLGEEGHIVDVTGGGNAFMGGMLAGMVLTGDFRTGESLLERSSRSVHLWVDGGVVRYSTEGDSSPIDIRERRAVERLGCLGQTQGDGTADDGMRTLPAHWDLTASPPPPRPRLLPSALLASIRIAPIQTRPGGVSDTTSTTRRQTRRITASKEDCPYKYRRYRKTYTGTHHYAAAFFGLRPDGLVTRFCLSDAKQQSYQPCGCVGAHHHQRWWPE